MQPVQESSTDGSGQIVDNDQDNDGVCDADEIEGCTDTQACNYDSTPTVQIQIMVYVFILQT